MKRCATSSRSRYSLRVFRRAACVWAACARNWSMASTSSGDARPGGRDGLQHRRPPLAARIRVQRQIGVDRRYKPIGAFAVGLVHDEDVGNLHDAGLERLHFVAGAWHERHDRDVGRADDVHFVLADADRLDDDDVLAGGVEHERGVAGRARQAAQVSARRHAADEHAFVGACACIRRRSPSTAPPVNGLVGSTAITPTVKPCFRSSAVSRSTSVLLPAPGGPVTPTDTRGPCWPKIARTRSALAGSSSSISEIARAIARGIARQHAVGERRVRSDSSCRAITSRWISLVPSPMVVSLTSRKYFSAG